MVIDTSVLIAVFREEPEADDLISSIGKEPIRLLSAASYVEVGIVYDARFLKRVVPDLQQFLLDAEIEIAPVTKQQAEIAREAYRRFGKGNHPAKLNFGDCFAYALAKSLNQPLLFKGDDFSKTDIETVTV